MSWRLLKCLKTFKNWSVHYRKRYRSQNGETVDLILRRGGTIRARSGTSDLRTARSIFLDESYLPKPMTIPEDGTVVDIGAHIGCFTIFAALRAKRGRIVSAEPAPDNFALLRENVRRNGFGHVETLNAAVAGTAGDRMMCASANPRTTGGNSLYGGEGASTFPVRCLTLPGIMEEHRLRKIDFLKLDCEGAEKEIIDSLADGELARIDRIAMEIHNPPGLEDSLNRLRRSGFTEIPPRKSNYRYFYRRAVS